VALTHSQPAARRLPQWAAALTVENALYAAVFLLAVALRFGGLGAHPLNEAEAREALSVWRFVRGLPEAAQPASPAYFFFTAIHFLIFPPGEWAARLAPALAGSLLVLLPWFFRDWLGRWGALVASGLLAVSSSLIAASRGADGTLLALLAWGLALALLRRFAAGGSANWGIGAAVALGVGLAGGGSFLTGLLVIGLMTLVVARTQAAEGWDWSSLADRLRQERTALLLAGALSGVLVATVGLTYRAGLGALAGSWLNWLTGFAVTAAGRSAFAIPVFLLTYEPLILVFGLLGLGRAFFKGDLVGQILGGLTLIALLFALFYSGRTLFDSVWVVTPLALLAARTLAALADELFAPAEWPLAAALTGVLTALVVFAALNVVRYVDQARYTPALQQLDLVAWVRTSPSLLLAVLAVAVAGLVTYLFGVGWSMRAALGGSLLTGVGALLSFTLAAGWGLAQTRPTEPGEVWWARPTADDVWRLTSTLADLSNFSVGEPYEIEATLQADPNGALAWALRDFTKTTFVDELGAFIESPVVITPEAAQNPALGSAYVGQPFTVARFWYPENLFWHEQIDWLVFRRAPSESERLILWVRQDVQQLRSAQP